MGYNPSEASTNIDVLSAAKAIFNYLYIRCKQPDGTFKIYDILAGESPSAVPGAGNIGFEYRDIEAYTTSTVSRLFIYVVDDTGRTIIEWAVSSGTLVRSQRYYFDMPNRNYGLSVIIGHDTTEDDRRDFTVTVSPTVTPTTLTLTAPSSAMISMVFTVSGKLTESATGVGIGGKTISLYYNSTLLRTFTTSSDGSYSGSTTINEVGNFTLKTSFAGDADYGPSEATSPITITKVPTTITLDPLPSPIYENTPFTVSGALTYDSRGIEGRTITLTYNSTYIADVTTGAGGSFSVDVTIPTAGTYTITADFAGDMDFEPSSATTPPFDVLPPAAVKGTVTGFSFPSPVQVNVYSDFYIDITNVGNLSGQVFAVLENSSGNPGDIIVIWGGMENRVSPGTHIALRPTGNVNPGETFRAASSIKYEIEGSYSLKIQAWHKNPDTGMDEGPDDEKTTVVDVTPAAIDTAITISAPASVYVNENFTISGALTRVDTGAGLSGMTVNLYYDTTLLVSVTTDTNGNYSGVVSIPTVGSYVLKAEFPGTATYGTSYSAIPITAEAVTGPVGLWSFPILTRLANIFPRAKTLLERITGVSGA